MQATHNQDNRQPHLFSNEHASLVPLLSPVCCSCWSMLVDGVDSWRYTYVGHDQIWAERLHIWCIICKKNKCTDLSNAMQLLLSDPGYNKLSDMDKLRTLQFKAITPSLPRYDPDESWSLIYHANFYINYTL